LLSAGFIVFFFFTPLFSLYPSVFPYISPVLGGFFVFGGFWGRGVFGFYLRDGGYSSPDSQLVPPACTQLSQSL